MDHGWCERQGHSHVAQAPDFLVRRGLVCSFGVVESPPQDPERHGSHQDTGHQEGESKACSYHVDNDPRGEDHGSGKTKPPIPGQALFTTSYEHGDTHDERQHSNRCEHCTAKKAHGIRPHRGVTAIEVEATLRVPIGFGLVQAFVGCDAVGGTADLVRADPGIAIRAPEAAPFVAPA